MKLTIDLIARGTSGYTRKKRDETMQHYLRRLTHLYLENKGIDLVGEDLSLCRNLVVLYLYDNQLSRIPFLNQNHNLTHLYLQNNHISKIENLAPLGRLTKLYLGGNSITVIEGLEKLECLQELHIENQHLPRGEKLLFDPRSLQSLSRSLQVLNISGNKLDSIREVQCFPLLIHLNAGDNELVDMKELAHVFGATQHLWRLVLMGNPICHKAKYRDRVIIMSSKRLESLDGKDINPLAKQFLMSWTANRDAHKKKRSGLIRRAATLVDFSKGRDLPPVAIPVKTGSASGYMMPGLPRKQFDEILARTHGMGDSVGHGSMQKPRSSEAMRSKYSAGDSKHNISSSAPIRRKPFSSVSIELSGNFNSSHHVETGVTN